MLISAWSKEVIVVEATEKSGALWTAQFAQKYGRRIYAVPHQIDVAEGIGTNELIAKGIATPYLGIGSLELAGKQTLLSVHTDRDSLNKDNKFLPYLHGSTK